MSLGENIKKLRKEKGLTQKELGLIVNKKEITIRKYESGDISPNMEVLTKIVGALDVPLNALIENKISSVDDLFDMFNIDKSFLELSQVSGLNMNILDKIFSPYRKGYTNKDIEVLGKSLNLTDSEIQDWILFNNKKPYENKRETEIFYWYQCIENYPYETVEGVEITELKLKDIREIVKELDSTFRNKVNEIGKR